MQLLRRNDRFDAAELWSDGQHGVCVHVDLWDSYLEPA